MNENKLVFLGEMIFLLASPLHPPVNKFRRVLPLMKSFISDSLTVVDSLVVFFWSITDRVQDQKIADSSADGWGAANDFGGASLNSIAFTLGGVEFQFCLF
ncbi:hypothetical protein CEXT_388751 [Caerostris extrusa]|uniref:Uncharacterized protein n=1 Tax=Caerostris extrusa TaxID=172846 RepID=A0AAV4YGI9_CAEEX|nr:hypothetical protein CEXT_388751 [Caerostris extrusa]